MLKIEHRDAVLLLTLDRREKRNALHPELIRGLAEALTQARTDTSLGVVVVTRRRAHVLRGTDLTHLASLGAEQKVEYLRLFFALFQQIYELPQPVIAAINGAAIAGGFDIAAACDLRLCSLAATFAQTEVLLGITQILYPVYKVIGLGCAKQLALTGEPITADEAQRIGLVNGVHPAESLVEQALKLAERLASRLRQALFETKRLSREVIEVNTQAAITRMFQVISERLRSDEHRREIQRYLAGLKAATLTASERGGGGRPCTTCRSRSRWAITWSGGPRYARRTSSRHGRRANGASRCSAVPSPGGPGGAVNGEGWRRDLVSAEYRGGCVVQGRLLAKVLRDGRLDMRYARLNQEGAFMLGRCISTHEVLPEGRLKLKKEEWQWLMGDPSRGY